MHAYLFVGPPGSTKDDAARAFAALLLAGVDDPDQRDARLALAGEHPDVREVRAASGARISAEQIDEIIRNASLAPVESDRKVMILDEFHLLEAAGRGAAAEDDRGAAGEHACSSSSPTRCRTSWSRSRPRCVRIEFARDPPRADRGDAWWPRAANRDARAAVAAAAGGDLDRARVLASDPGLRAAARRVRRRPRTASTAPAHRGRRWRDEIVALADEAARRRSRRASAAEIAELEERVSAARRARQRPQDSWRSGTSASCAATAPTSCAAGSA